MKKPLLALSVAAFAIAVYLAWPRTDATLPGSAEAGSGIDSPAVPGDLAQVPPRSEVGTERGAALPAADPIDAGRVYAVHGRVFDVSGRPLSGVPIRDRTVLGESDATGAFAVEVNLATSATLVAEGNGYAPLLNSVVEADNHTREHVLVAGPAIELAGIVVDQNGAALVDARVGLYPNDAVLRDFPYVLDMTTPVSQTVTSSADGRFDLGEVAAAPRRFLSTSLGGYASQRTPAPDYDRQDLYVVLTRKEGEPEITVDGFVLLPDGRPAIGAKVQAGFDEALTDDNGAFSLPLRESLAADQVLVAGLRNYGTVAMSRFGEVIRAAAPNPPAPVTLVLRDQPQNISGQVVDATGSPQQGWIVSITEGTAVTRNMTPPVLVEGFGTGPRAARPVTGADGAFVLADLMDREYRIRAYQRRTLLSVITDPIPAGTQDARIVIEDGLTHEVVRGLVLSPRGLPQPAATVSLGLVTHRMENGMSWATGVSTTTDTGGRFELRDVPRRYVHLDIAGETIIPTRFELGPDVNPDDLRITAPSRCHFKVNVTGGDLEGLRMEIHDAGERPLSIYSFRAQGSSSSTSQGIDQGQTMVYGVSELGAMLLIFRGQQIVGQRQILLDADGVNELTVELR